MNEELKKYNDELELVQAAIDKVDGMIHTKEGMVADMQKQLDDLTEKRGQIEKAIEEKEREASNEEKEEQEVEEKAEQEAKVEEASKPSVEQEEIVAEVYETPLPSGLRIEKLDKGLMETVVGANKKRNENILKDMQTQAKAREEVMPEINEKEANSKASEVHVLEEDEIEK